MALAALMNWEPASNPPYRRSSCLHEYGISKLRLDSALFPQALSTVSAQIWSESESIKSMPVSDYLSGLASNSFCRNPYNTSDINKAATIWCFTTDTSVKWQTCSPVGVIAPATRRMWGLIPCAHVCLPHFEFQLASGVLRSVRMDMQSQTTKWELSWKSLHMCYGFWPPSIFCWCAVFLTGLPCQFLHSQRHTCWEAVLCSLYFILRVLRRIRLAIAVNEVAAIFVKDTPRQDGSEKAQDCGKSQLQGVAW